MATRYETIIANVQSMINQNAPIEDIDGYLGSLGITPDQFRKLVEGPTVKGYVKEIFKGLPTGAINLAESAAVGASALLPEELEAAARKGIKSTAEAARKPFAPAMGYEDTIPRKLSEATGSTAPFFLTGPVGAAVLGGAAGAGEARTAAEAKGETGEGRTLATILGIPVGLVDIVAPEVKVGKTMITRALVTGGVEGATETAQKIAQNLIAKGVYDPEQPIFAGSGEEGAYGAGAGALTRLLLDMALGRRGGGGGRGTQAAPGAEPTAPTPAPAPTGLPPTATQLPLGQVPELGVGYEGYRGVPEPYRQAEELDATRQDKLRQIVELRDQHDVLMRELDRLKTQYEEATEGQRESILSKAEPLNEARASLEEQINELSQGIEGAERAGVEATPGQQEFDFGKTETAPEDLTQDREQSIEQARINDIQSRVAAGQPVTLADTAFMSMAQRGDLAVEGAKPVPEISMPGERPEFSLGEQYLEPTVPMPEIPETRPVTEADFKAMGIGKTNKKLREAILGKDLADPDQRAEVKDVLTDYANNPNRSAKVIEGVNGFLTSPTFMEQGELDLRQPRKRRAKAEKEVADVVESGEPIGEAAEPSPAVAGERGDIPAGGVEAPVASGMDVAGEPTGQPDVGEGTQPAALEGATYEQPDVGSITPAVSPAVRPSTMGEAAPAVSPTAAEAVEGRAAPAVTEGRVDLRTATERLMRGANLKRAEASRLAEQLASSYGEVDVDTLERAISHQRGDRPLYRNKTKGKGTPAARVQKLVDSIVSRWKNAPRIQVVQSATELPAHLQQQMAEDKVTPPGAFDPDSETIFLIADHINGDMDAALTLAHEALGHYGMRSILGGSYAKVMDDIYNGNVAVRKAATKKMAQGLDKHTAVEEVLAEMAEKGVYNNAIQRAFNAIRQFFRRIGMDFKKVTDAEVRELLANAQRFVVSGGPKAEGKAAFRGKPLYRTREEKLSSDGERAAAFNERMKNIGNEPEPDVDLTFKERLMLHPERFKGMGMKIRQAVVDKDAPVKEQLNAVFQNKLRDAAGDVVGYVANEQAQEAAGLADQLMRRGGIRLTKDGLFEVYDRVENGERISIDRVFEIIIEDLGNRLGSAKTAVTLAHRSFIAQRANELNKRNEVLSKQADAAEAKGNTAAAKKLRAQIIKVRASQAEIDAGLEAMQEFPELKKAFEVFTKANEEKIDFLVAADRISAAEAQEWKDNIGYVPWTRVEEEENKLQEFGKLRSGNVHLSKLPQLDKEGSSKEIRNILDNMVGNTIWAVRSGLKNRAAIKSLDQLPSAVELKTQDALDAALADKATKHLVVYAYRGGERVAFKLENEIDLPAFSSVVDSAGVMLGAFKTAATGLRSFVTHMPTFALSQLSQDTVRAMFLSGVRHPFSLPTKVIKNFVKSVMGGASDIQALGITGAYDGMPEHAMQRARERHGLQERAAWRKMWDKLEHFSLSADMAVRAAIYEQTMQETGDRVLAFHRAKEYINFKTGGNDQTVRTLRQIVPFMNAYIQGMDVLYRTIKGKGLSMEDRNTAIALFATTGMKVAALSALYAALVGDDDDYKGLDDYERDKNFIIPGTGLKIPVAPEIGFLFKVIPERMLMAMSREGTDREIDSTTFMRGMRDAFINSYGGVSLTPQLVKPVIEVATNYSFFTGTPIVGLSMGHREVAEQFTDRTSEIAKLFGAVGISPMKVDHLLRGYLGTLGGVILDVTDAVADPNRMSKPINKLPLVSTFMYDDTGRGYKSEFYAFREEVDRVTETVNAFKREGRIAELQEYLTEDKIQMYAMHGVVNKMEETLGKLRQYRNIIINDQNLSPEEKREKVNEILKQEKEILQAYNVPQLRKVAGM